MADRPAQVAMVEEFLAAFPFMRAPHHIVVTDGLLSPGPGRLAIGASYEEPITRDSVLILPTAAAEVTVAHELLHSAFRLGEPGAYALQNLVAFMFDFKKRWGLGTKPRQLYAECSTAEGLACPTCGPVEVRAQGVRCFSLT